MRRVLTAPKADTLFIEAGSANVRIVVDELRKNVEATLDASGSQFEEAANKATLVGNKLTVPAITGTTIVSNGGMVVSGNGVTIVGGNVFGSVVIGNGTVQVNNFGGRGVAIGGNAGIAAGHLTVTVRIPKGVRVTVTTRSGDITASGLLTNANLHTSGGDIHVADVDGTTVLKTSGGDVVIDNTSGVLNATTSGGDVTARRVTGVAVLNTSGGDIYAHADHPTMLSAGTSGGNITISGRYDRNTVTASTSGGSVYYR
ncbi:DUF4097 family beta strand repeat-containing protein [Actinomadura mexicana]|uniref:Putative adhesin n=1 Tax=Actinomadura mexicana TaxID=134959 RepID=A0A239ALT9_9ACTN|nr:DUF4097 family beta strand repeat-containing protein [Actinomadura mexicana]SNR96646.1 Putative adhesin [Actinomadura mexicana]